MDPEKKSIRYSKSSMMIRSLGVTFNGWNVQTSHNSDVLLTYLHRHEYGNEGDHLIAAWKQTLSPTASELADHLGGGRGRSLSSTLAAVLGHRLELIGDQEFLSVGNRHLSTCAEESSGDSIWWCMETRGTSASECASLE